MVIVFVTMAGAGLLLLSLTLDQLPRSLRSQREGGSKEALKLALGAIKHMREPAQLLLIPLTAYTGMEFGFFTAEWTKVSAFVFQMYRY